MTLTTAFNNALSGLYVNQQALAVTSHNIANVNTEGYSRQTLDLSPHKLDGLGAGVRIEDITRQVDSFLQASVRRQYGTVGEREAISEYLERIQIRLGEPGETNSIDEYTENFFNAMQALAETPERISFQENAVYSASTLSRELSNLAEDLHRLRMQADTEISNSVDSLNSSLKSLFDVNISINQAVALGQPSASLKDDRDLLLEQISEEIDIEVYFQDSGEAHIYTGSGISLLDDGLYQFDYQEVNDLQIFLNNRPLNPLNLEATSVDGGRVVGVREIISSGTGESVESTLRGGRISGLQQIRDQLIPDILAQIDEFASTLRDEFNAIHNQGSAYPGVGVMEGSRSVFANDRNMWEGGIRISLMDQQGQPIPSLYTDESHTGFRSLELDLANLDGGFGAGNPDVQTIIDEINNHFGAHTIKNTVGNFNNIQLTSAVNAMPDAPAQFEFDFDIENISGLDADLFITGMTVVDDTGTDITAFNTPPKTVAIDAAGSYTTTAGSNVISISAAGHSLQEGDIIYLSDPGVTVDGIPAASLTGFFEVGAVNGNSFEIALSSAGAVATAGGSFSVAGVTASIPQDNIATGEKRRTSEDSRINLDLTGNPASSYYDIQVSVGVNDGEGGISGIETSVITYRVQNYRSNLLNQRYNAENATGDAVRSSPFENHCYMKAMLVDEDGVELPKDSNGDYVKTKPGYLVLQTDNENHSISIENLEAAERGQPNVDPESIGTGRGFSHYFELNNFFKSNSPTSTGDTVESSAYNLEVEERFEEDSGLVSLGLATLTQQPSDPDATPLYTYERYIGDNRIAQQLADLSNTTVAFDSAGGLDNSVQSFNGYLGEFIAYNSAQAANYETLTNDSAIILNGFIERSDTFKGVNIDEELANTIIFQNAYTASARVITVADEMFEALLNAF